MKKLRIMSVIALVGMLIGFADILPATAAGSYYVIPYYDCTWNNLTDPYLNPSVCSPTIQLTPNETHELHVYAEGLAPTYTSIVGLQINWTINNAAGGSFSSTQTFTDSNGSTTDTFTAGTTGYYVIQATSNDGNTAEFSVNIACPAGYYDNGSECVAADPGYYVASAGATSQTPCPPGTFQPLAGAVSCVAADPGHFVSVLGSIEETLCPVGTYQPSSGAVSCLPADPGHYVDQVGSIEQSLCAPGTYQPTSGASSCLLADPGYFVDVSGAISETLCPTGFTSDAGAVICTPINTPPTVDAGGPYSEFEGSTVSLNAATASDWDSDPLMYSWSVNSASCSFNDASLLNPDLTCYAIGSFTATLSVSDGVNPAVTSDTPVNVSAPTPASLSALVSDYVNKSGIAHSLTAKLKAVQNAIDKGNPNAKAGAVQAFINEVNAQSGKSISTDDAAILIALAQDL